MAVRTHTYPSGRKLSADVGDFTVWRDLVAHYGQDGREHLWNCPVCNAPLAPFCDDVDDNCYLDTYRCGGVCAGLWVTHNTPTGYVEYHQVPDEDWLISVEGLEAVGSFTQPMLFEME